MSKHMTRKGLAFGAGFALAITGVVPSAQAVGEDGLVTLAPASGTSYKTLLTSAFDLEANFAQSLEESGTYLKFMVTDTTETTKFDLDINGSTADAATAWAGTALFDTTGGTHEDQLTITITTGSGLRVGDIVTVDAATAGLDGTYEVKSATTGDTVWVLQDTDANATADVTVAENITITQFGHNGLNTRARVIAGGFGTDAVVGVTTSVDDRATDDTYVVRASDSNNSSSVLRLVTEATVTSSYSVVAWHDTDGDNVIDGSESKSPARTVTFVKPSEAVVTTTLAAPALNDTSLSATVVIADVNMQQLAGDVTVRFARNGYNKPHANGDTAGTPSGTAWADDSVTYSSLKTALDTGAWDIPDSANAYDSSASGTEGLDEDKVDSATWSATAYYGGAILGGASSTNATNTTVNGYTIALDSNANANGKYITDTDITSGAAASGATGYVRTSTKSFNVTITLTTNTTTKLAAANIPVSVVVAPTNLATADAVTVNGTSVSTSNKTITGVTDASGKFVLAVTTATGNASDSLAFTPTIQAFAQNALTVEWADATYNLYNTQGEVDTSNDIAATIVPGGSIQLSYRVVDQFGAAPANGSHAIVVKRAVSSARTTAASWQYQANVTDGVATVNVADNGAGTGADTVTAELWKIATGGALTGSAINSQAFVLTYASAATATATAITATVNNNGVALTNGTAVYPIAIESKAFVALDTRYSLLEVPSYASNNAFNDKTDTTADAQLTLSGSLTNAQGAGTSGVVTITSSKPGVLFKATSGSSKYVYAKDSITVRTANGSYSVEVYGQVGGKVTFTASSGSLSKTVDVTFAAAASQGAAVSLDVPASVNPGTTFRVTGYLKDAFGNGVELASAGSGSNPTLVVTYDGPGFVSGSLPTTTDATGKFTFNVLLGTNDRGSATITVSFDADGTGTTKAAVSASKTVAIGSGAASGTGKVNVGSFNGKLVVYASGLSGSRISWKVGGNWGSQVASSNYAIFNRPTPRAGVTVTVDIYVNGVKTLTKSVVTR